MHARERGEKCLTGVSGCCTKINAAVEVTVPSDRHLGANIMSAIRDPKVLGSCELPAFGALSGMVNSREPGGG